MPSLYSQTVREHVEAPEPPALPLDEGDAATIAALRAGDEAAFASLIDRYGAPLERLAFSYVRDREAARDAVQDAWIGLLNSLDRFEGRSSLKTWLFRIALNCARARARKERRSMPFSLAFASEALAPSGVGFDRIPPSWVPTIGGAWRSPPAKWISTPEQQAIASETREHVKRAIDSLPARQREVILLRDMEGLTSDEVCNILALSDTNQRVLLHRARSKVRQLLEEHLAEAKR